jgi:nucleoside-diphosphate-sugar epimerase
VVPRFFAAALAGEPMEIHGDGGQSRDFTYVSDAVAATLLAASAPAEAWGRAFNVAGGERVTVSALAAAVAAILGSTVPPRHVPARAGDVRDSQADLGAVRRLLGFTPRVPLSEGLLLAREHYATSVTRPFD